LQGSSRAGSALIRSCFAKIYHWIGVDDPWEQSREFNGPHPASESRRWTRKARRKPILETLFGTGKRAYQSCRTKQWNSCQFFAAFNQFTHEIEPAAVEVHVAFYRAVVNGFAVFGWINSEFQKRKGDRPASKLAEELPSLFRACARYSRVSLGQAVGP
jgi:hypothetical protein